MINYKAHFVILLVFFLFNYSLIRRINYAVIDYCLNKSAGKKRRKGQTFKERFFYTRYRDIIPKILIKWYYVNMVYYLILCFSIVVMAFVDFGDEKTMDFCFVMNGIASVPSVIALFMTKGYKLSRDEQFDVSGWVKRKKRNKK